MAECEHKRTARISGKCADMAGFAADMKDGTMVEGDGYAPRGLGVGGGDYISVTFCMDCGKVQGAEFPMDDEAVKMAMEGM